MRWIDQLESDLDAEVGGMFPNLKNKPQHIRACFPLKTSHSLATRRARRTDEAEF
jgi:hypothetical protein